ncbi:MAG: hypothetical protein BWY11_00539 [Firmicutes bacterium ADurb.Bin182]|nr:MAG: hypothetical protein BWY11_00539 [Firmicutes bacterium ADurb.Bin182]
MESMMSTVVTIAAMAVVCMLLEMLLPKSALKSSVAIIIGIAFLLTAAEPIIGLIKKQDQPVIERAAGIFEEEERDLQPYRDFLLGIFSKTE